MQAGMLFWQDLLLTLSLYSHVHTSYVSNRYDLQFSTVSEAYDSGEIITKFGTILRFNMTIKRDLP